ncbi:MAG: nuclear transport factor 2 family protein [Actinomycetota bacterium]
MTAKLDNATALYMEGIRDGNARQAVEKYTGDRYTQHSTGVRDGVEGFVEFFEPFIERNPDRDIRIVRSWEDGQYVFVHAYQNINNGEAEWVTTDFFDTDENDKIIEHWDIIAPYHGTMPSGRTSVDGPTEVTDLDKTEENKAVVRQLIEQVLMGADPGRIDEFIAEDYRQHNPDVPDGLAAFRELAMQPDPPLAYHEIVLMVGQGNFVATLCRASWEGAPYAQADIFRLENGKVAEHWDNVEPIGPEEEWVNSGKF